MERPDQIAELTNSNDYMGERIVLGNEYTINTYVSQDGNCICSIPHERISLQNGEPVQATNAKIPELLDSYHSIVSTLQGTRGPINIQVFYKKEAGKPEVVEINPRLGGGFPLADKAGGSFIESLALLYLDGRELTPFSQWTGGLRMMRYRDAFFDFPIPKADSSLQS